MTQVKSKSGKVIRTYPLALKCLNQAHRRQINLRIKDLENKQLDIIDKKTLETAISFYRSNPWDRFPRSKISKEVGKSPNIAEKDEKILQSTNFPSLHVRDTGTILSSDV